MSTEQPHEHENRPVPPLPSQEEFGGRVAVVTGGSDGLGRHLCQTLVSLGSEVFFCGRREALGEPLEHEWGPHAHYIRCDLAAAEEAEAFVRQAGEHRGHIDYLVNNAAIDPATPIRETTLDEFDQVMAVNLRAYFAVSRAAVPYLEKGQGRAIVNICTTNYMFGFAGMTAYNAAKSGIVGFSRSLARELGPLGIRVNVVSPGWIMTRRQRAEKATDKDRRDLVESQCIKTVLTEEHVTPVTLFLLSKAAAGICGQNIVADGGKFMY